MKGKAKDVVNEQTKEIASNVRKWIKDNPTAATGIAFGVGAMIGSALLSRRR